jgi:cobalt/nickel transport system permease protein
VHIPDGFINATTSVGAGAAAIGSLGGALKRGSRTLKDRQIPLAGLAAAFIFTLQMLNFPVAAGTSGHLLGGALAAILLGPSLGITVVAVVIFVQALLFADGGLSAIGLNVVNMAVITSLAGWGVFRLITALLPKRIPSLLAATMIASWVSVVAASLGFVLEYWLGGQGGVPIGTVLGAMAGVHALIGIGEGLITATVVGAVVAVRPDLVFGAVRAGIERSDGHARVRRGTIGGFVAGGLGAALLLVTIAAPLASSAPDGLNKVASDTGIAVAEQAHPIGGPLASYGVAGVENGPLGTIVAGAVGVVVTFAVGLIFVGVSRRRRRSAETVPAS